MIINKLNKNELHRLLSRYSNYLIKPNDKEIDRIIELLKGDK